MTNLNQYSGTFPIQSLEGMILAQYIYYLLRGLPLFTGPAGYEKIGKDHETEGPHLGRTMKQ